MTNREKFLEFLVQLSFGILLCFVLLLAVGLEKEQLIELVTTGTLKAAVEQTPSENSSENLLPSVEKKGSQQLEEQGEKQGEKQRKGQGEKQGKGQGEKQGKERKEDGGADLSTSSGGVANKITTDSSIDDSKEEGDFSELFE